MCIDCTIPGLGITRIRFNGYNLSLRSKHPLDCRGKGKKKSGLENSFSNFILPRSKKSPNLLIRDSGDSVTQSRNQ